MTHADRMRELENEWLFDGSIPDDILATLFTAKQQTKLLAYGVVDTTQKTKP